MLHNTIFFDIETTGLSEHDKVTVVCTENYEATTRNVFNFAKAATDEERMVLRDTHLGKTMFLTKVTTVRDVFQLAQFFLENDPSLQVIDHDFTSNMFSVEDIEILGTPLGTDIYIKHYV